MKDEKEIKKLTCFECSYYENMNGLQKCKLSAKILPNIINKGLIPIWCTNSTNIKTITNESNF